ncbi:MAG: bacteriocin-protection protein [Anaerolineae bacterium]|nr:bacteriocin-protection protein [Anaerolineae bacterium]
MIPIFFDTATELRAWFAKNHPSKQELHIGYYKKDSGQIGVTYPESVDEALCFGWIDGVRHSIDEISYTNRFTPRKANSPWSAVNIKRAKELIALGRMQPAGLKAFEARDERAANDSYEQRHNAALTDVEQKQFQANPAAWAFFEGKAPSYRKAALLWVVSAKQAATRQKRLATLIEDSANGSTIAPLTRKPK